MILLPAIDLKDGQAVRLYKGDYNKKTVYSDNPVELAKEFERCNATWLHVVDLDGAKQGSCINGNVIRQIRKETSLKVEVGGGIRSMDTVDYYLQELQIDRVIIGTAAISNKDFLQSILDKYGSKRLVVGVDVKDGFVAVEGWLETSNVQYLDFITELEKMGVQYIVATDISKDGTLQGPNFDMYQKISITSSINVVVSGGIKDSDDIYQVAKSNYYGCIVGKAYYEKKLDLQEVIECLQKESYPV